MKNADIFKQDDFRTQYELAKQFGDRRFGTACSHEKVEHGRCLKCLRKVVSQINKHK